MSKFSLVTKILNTIIPFMCHVVGVNKTISGVDNIRHYICAFFSVWWFCQTDTIIYSPTIVNIFSIFNCVKIILRVFTGQMLVSNSLQQPQQFMQSLETSAVKCMDLALTFFHNIICQKVLGQSFIQLKKFEKFYNKQEICNNFALLLI